MTWLHPAGIVEMQLHAKSAILLLMACCLVQGCAVGPDFTKPAAPTVANYVEGSQPEQTVQADPAMGDAQHFVPGLAIQSDWWTLFGSGELDRLVKLGLSHNPTLEAAGAALVQAEQNVLAERASLLIPAVNAQAGETRQRVSPASFGFLGNPNTFNLANASVGVTYTFDLFGGNRRLVESFEAQVDVQRYALKAARATLAANIVTAAVREASLRAQLAATEAMLTSESRSLQLLQVREAAGAVPHSDVLMQQATLAQTQATLPELHKQLAQVRHQLAIYVGRFPSDADLPAFQLADLHLPPDLPVTIPSRLVEQRPDIQVSEAKLHAATAQLGVTQSQMLPNITLSASYGSVGGRPSDLFSPATTVWSLGGNILQPIFHGGALKAGERASQAAVEEASAQYRSTVLNAFQNVADTLRALEADAAVTAAQTIANDAARRSYELTKTQFAAGATSYLTLLLAEDRYQQSQQALIIARSARLADSAALYLAMGGG